MLACNISTPLLHSNFNIIIRDIYRNIPTEVLAFNIKRIGVESKNSGGCSKWKVVFRIIKKQ